MFKEDLKKACINAMPVFKEVAKWIAALLGISMWIALNLLLSFSVSAVLSLWALTFVCGVVALEYHKVQSEKEREAYFARREAEWEAKYGYPYPR
jgi:hypothetical protein